MVCCRAIIQIGKYEAWRLHAEPIADNGNMHPHVNFVFKKLSCSLLLVMALAVNRLRRCFGVFCQSDNPCRGAFGAFFAAAANKQ